MPVQERERMTELGWVDGGVEVFEEQMLGDQGVLPPGARNAFVPCRDRHRLYTSYCPDCPILSFTLLQYSIVSNYTLATVLVLLLSSIVPN